MNESLQKNLIATIRENIPEDVNINTFLADTLFLGRESVYRRLRGEIQFTFEEIVTLSQKLNFSIDNIAGMKKNENALFNIHMLQDSDYLDIYVNKMLEYGKMFREMNNYPNTTARLAVNSLPYYFHIRYDNLSRFRIFKWLYQNQKVDTPRAFSDFVLPDKVLKTHKIFNQDIQQIKNVVVFLDNNVFWSAVKDIEYFLKRNILSDEDVAALKAELHDMINQIEYATITGKVKLSGAKVNIYSCAVDLEASYLHFEYGEHQFSQVRIFSISAIDSYNVRLCNIQKKWIDSLKSYSTLISESGEMQRLEYLNGQRNIIDSTLTVNS